MNKPLNIFKEILSEVSIGLICTFFFFFLFGVLRRFQHCTGHITTGSWKGRGNQYIEFARVLYCKLPTNGKQLPAFPHKALTGSNPGLRGGRRECYHSATVAPAFSLRRAKILFMNTRTGCTHWCMYSNLPVRH